jgi:signal transduction histidine kinase
VALTVTDNGVGIEIQQQARIFEKFEQAVNGQRKEADGTGLGLALTRALVELQGGTISVVSSPGAGSSFTIRLSGDLATEAA